LEPATFFQLAPVAEVADRAGLPKFQSASDRRSAAISELLQTGREAEKKKFWQVSNPLYIFNQMVIFTESWNRTFGRAGRPGTRRRILAHSPRRSPAVTIWPSACESLPAFENICSARESGLLRRRRYVVSSIEIGSEADAAAAEWVEEYRKFWEGSLDRLAAYLEKRKQGEERKNLRPCVGMCSKHGAGTAASAISGGGLAAFVLINLPKKQTNQTGRNKMKLKRWNAKRKRAK